MFDKYEVVGLMLHCQSFIELIRQKKPIEAMNYAEVNLENCHNKKIKIYSVDNQIQEIEIKEIIGLLCYENPEDSELRHFLSHE